MDFEIKRPMWNPSSTTLQLAKLGQTIFSQNLGLEKDMNGILTDLLCGNASDNCLPFLSLSLLFLFFLLSFLSIMSIKSPFLAPSPLVCFAKTVLIASYQNGRSYFYASLASSGWNGFHFLLSSWDFTHPSRSNRSITSSLPSFLFPLSRLPP